MSNAPLRYRPDIETIDPDEQKTIDAIIAGMTGQSEVVEKREGRAVRASHAKSSACVTGELIVPDLPPELAQGLFAKPGRYPVAVRFAQGPGETLGDRVSTHRGMSIKVFGVKGERLPGHDAPVQDFVLATGTTFPSGTAKGFLRDGTVISGSAGSPELLKSAVSSAARNFNRALHAFGADSSKADFFGHPFSHPLADSYFSQTAMRWGDHVAKLGVVPASPAQTALVDWRLDPHQDEDGFRHAAVTAFADHDIVFELRAQLWTDAERQPIEDASVDWPAEISPYRTIGTIRLPRQQAYSPERVRFFDEVMTFRPAHSLAAHRPLGSANRARLQVYRALSAFRHRENGVAGRDLASIDEIPRATGNQEGSGGAARLKSGPVSGRLAALFAVAAVGAALAVGAVVRSRRGIRSRQEAQFDHQGAGERTYEINHIERGTGRKLLLIHGLGGSWRSWSTILDPLSVSRTVIAIDLPGHGATPADHDSGTFDGLVGSVQRYIANNDLAGIDVVGSSMGARIVLELARRGLVGNVVALDPGGFWRGWERTFFKTTIGVSGSLLRTLRPGLPILSRHAASRTALLAQLSARPWALDPEIVATELKGLSTTPTFSALVDDLATGPEQTGPAAESTGRIVIGWGKHDRLCLPRQAARAKAAFPSAELHWFESSGHFPMWDTPEETVDVILAATRLDMADQRASD